MSTTTHTITYATCGHTERTQITWTGGATQRDSKMGRPEIGPQIKVRLSRALIERVDHLAGEEGVTRSAWIRQAVTRAAATSTTTDTGGLVRITAEWRGVAVDTSDGYTGPATIVTPVIEIDDDTPVGEIASWAVWSYAPWERGIDCVGIDDTTAPDARDIVVEETTEPAALTSSDLMRSCDLGETAAACGEEHGFIWSSIAAADIVFLTLEEARAALDTSDDRPVDEIGYWYDSSAGYVRGVSVVDEIDEVLAGIAAGDRRESALFEMPGRWIAEDSGRRLRGAAHAIEEAGGITEWVVGETARHPGEERSEGEDLPEW